LGARDGYGEPSRVAGNRDRLLKVRPHTVTLSETPEKSPFPPERWRGQLDLDQQGTISLTTRESVNRHTRSRSLGRIAQVAVLDLNLNVTNKPPQGFPSSIARKQREVPSACSTARAAASGACASSPRKLSKRNSGWWNR
jgi:hypothetical protein